MSVFLSPRVRLESVVGAKKITASRRCRQLASLRQKTSAIMPSPTALKCCPQVSASHLSHPPAARWARPAPQANSPVAAGPRDLGVPVLDPTVRVPVPPLFFLLDRRILLCGHRAFDLSGFSQGGDFGELGAISFDTRASWSSQVGVPTVWPAQCFGAAKR